MKWLQSFEVGHSDEVITVEEYLLGKSNPQQLLNTIVLYWRLHSHSSWRLQERAPVQSPEMMCPNTILAGWGVTTSEDHILPQRHGDTSTTHLLIKLYVHLVHQPMPSSSIFQHSHCNLGVRYANILCEAPWQGAKRQQTSLGTRHHSLRDTFTSRLYESEANEQLVMERSKNHRVSRTTGTGHLTSRGLLSYLNGAW